MLSYLDEIKSTMKFKNKIILRAEESILRNTVSRNRYLLGNYHNKTLASIITLVVNLEVQGKLDESISLLREIITIKRNKIGKRHPITMAYTIYLAHILDISGKIDEKNALFKEIFTS